MASPSPTDTATDAGDTAASPSPPRPPSSSRRRIPPPCWTPEETVALIESYRDKWHALRRVNLKASHWDDVAAALALRCPSNKKTPLQCRHKLEKLRKRFRSERHRSLSRDPSLPPSSSWALFPLMLSLDQQGDDEDDKAQRLHRFVENGLRFRIPKAARSKIAANPNPRPGFGGRVFGGMRPPVEEMRRRLEEKTKPRRRNDEEKEEDEGEGEEGFEGEMAEALRVLGDKYARVEQSRMEMAAEMERVRMEMELRRTEMILDSQRRIVDAFVKGFAGGGRKRARVSPDA